MTANLLKILINGPRFPLNFENYLFFVNNADKSCILTIVCGILDF